MESLLHRVSLIWASPSLPMEKGFRKNMTPYMFVVISCKVDPSRPFGVYDAKHGVNASFGTRYILLFN